MVVDVVVGVLGAVAAGWLTSRLLEGHGTALNTTRAGTSVVGSIMVITRFRRLAPRLRDTA